VYRRGIDFDLVNHPEAESELLQFSLGDQSISVPRPSMGGKHQLDNLATALAALLLMNPDCLSKADEIAAAIHTCSVPGRLQKVSSAPEILLDVGHNELAAEVVAAYLQDNNRSNVTCVLAMLADKPAEAVALALGNVCTRWLCADSPSDRGQSGELLASRVKTALPSARVSSFRLLDQAMQTAVSTVNENNTILVFGSFTTVSAAAGWLQNSMQRDGHDAAKITRGEPGTYPRDQ